MYIPKQWLLPLALSFLLALAFIWLVGQNAALDAKVEAMSNQMSSEVSSADNEISDLKAALAVRAGAPAAIVPVNGAGMPLDVAPASNVDEIICAEPSEAGAGTAAAETESGGGGSASGGGGGGGGGNSGDGGYEVSIEKPKEIGNYATNSGSILDSFFLDGGQGSVGINIYKSVLTGVNFATPVIDGSNSTQTGTGNSSLADVRDNHPTNTNTPSYSDLSISTPVSVNGTIGPETSVGVGDAQQGSSTPASTLNESPVASGATGTTSTGTPNSESEGTGSPNEGSGGGGDSQVEPAG